MNLKKETLSYYNETQGYNKEYDQFCRLIHKHEYSPIIGSEKTDFSYDDQGRLSKELIKSYSLTGVLSVVLKDFNYNSNKKLKITYSRFKNRNYFKDQNSSFNIGNETKEVFKIETVEYSNDLLVYRNIEDFDKKIEKTEEFKYDVNNNCTDFIENGKVKFNKEFIYDNDLITQINEYKYWNNKKFLAFIENNFYDENRDLKKREKRGLYNSRMYLYEVLSFNVKEDFYIELEKSYRHFSEFLGYYNYETMLQENEDNFQLVFLKADVFEGREFDVFNFMKKDSRGDLVESYYAGNETSEKFNHEIYIHDYIDGEKKDFEIGLKLDKNYSVEKNYIKKFYY